MADPKTWIDVADTAITVGLAALIGGGISYFTTRLDHDREAKKEYAKRRMDNIELAFSEINEFSKSVSLYWASLANGVYKKNESTLTEEDRKSLNNEEQKLFEGFSVLNSARTRLVLLSENVSAKKLDKYKSTCDEFFKIANVDNVQCTEANLINCKEKMIQSREVLLEALSKTYGKSA
jgi:hypothetical protein